METDYWQVVGQVMDRLKRRSLLIMMTDVLDSASSSGLMINLARAASRHLVLCVVLTEPRIADIAESEPETLQDAYVKAAACAYETAAASGTGNDAQPRHHGSGNFAGSTHDSIDTPVSGSAKGESAVTGSELMEERISIITPDHVELDFELGRNRLTSARIHHGPGPAVPRDSDDCSSHDVCRRRRYLFRAPRSNGPASVAATILVFIIFLLNWGYFVAFEALNKGQTPGKRWTGLRVVQDNGLPIGWREATLRNFARIADIMPPPACFVGGLTILLSKRGKRLGDLLAGTMVIREDFGQTATRRHRPLGSRVDRACGKRAFRSRASFWRI